MNTKNKDYKYLIGKKFGKLTILEWWREKITKDGIKEYGFIMCLCSCECGNKKNIALRSMQYSSVKTCNLCPKTRGNQHTNWQGYGEISKNLWTTYQRSAKVRGYEFNIDMKYAWELFEKQERKCSLTGWKLYFNPSYKEQKNKNASLDRIDSTKGYEEGNVQWVHRDVNKLKKNLDNNYFIDLCMAISDNIKNKKGEHLNV